MSVSTRDHLFVSFSPEDWALAEWLTLKLTQEGYRVWCARFPILDGERYPREVEDAISFRAFRVLALVSRAALANPATTREWTLAIDGGRARGESLLIQLAVEAIDARELHWAAPDSAPISFDERWEAGLDRLLTTLRSADAPRPLVDGERVATEARHFMASRRSWHTVL